MTRTEVGTRLPSLEAVLVLGLGVLVTRYALEVVWAFDLPQQGVAVCMTEAFHVERPGYSCESEIKALLLSLPAGQAAHWLRWRLAYDVISGAVFMVGGSLLAASLFRTKFQLSASVAILGFGWILEGWLNALLQVSVLEPSLYGEAVGGLVDLSIWSYRGLAVSVGFFLLLLLLHLSFSHGYQGFRREPSP